MKSSPSCAGVDGIHVDTVKATRYVSRASSPDGLLHVALAMQAKLKKAISVVGSLTISGPGFGKPGLFGITGSPSTTSAVLPFLPGITVDGSGEVTVDSSKPEVRW